MGINAEAEVQEGAGHCMWITTASDGKFHTTESYRYILYRTRTWTIGALIASERAEKFERRCSGRDLEDERDNLRVKPRYPM